MRIEEFGEAVIGSPYAAEGRPGNGLVSQILIRNFISSPVDRFQVAGDPCSKFDSQSIVGCEADDIGCVLQGKTAARSPSKVKMRIR